MMVRAVHELLVDLETLRASNPLDVEWGERARLI
jgi:hypothetical protein